jgi:hypothetical protein
MKATRPIRCFIAVLTLAGCLQISGTLASEVDTAAATTPRLIVITDIGTEPDDLQSLVRLLVYANDLDIEGLIASTSRHLRNRVHPELIERRIGAYGEVLPNLRVHDSDYPEAEALRAVVRASDPLYGMDGVGKGHHVAAAQLIIDAVDRPDARPVWVTVWGGAAPLAQALWTVRETRSPEELEKFVAKLRVYTISDQDDAGPWIRMTFPRLFWISSIHAFTQYGLSTWLGITAAEPGSDPSLATRTWLDENIRSQGPLGALYPSPIFGVEGDTPSFLYLIPNGLGNAEHPDWGSWGGRYGQIADFLGLWTDTQDTVKGIDGKYYTSNKATVWRWRRDYQNDFAARMDWTVAARYEDANHPPLPSLNGEAGLQSIVFPACPGETVTLSAADSHDPDGDGLSYRWFWYRESDGIYSPALEINTEEGPETKVTINPWLQPAEIPLPGQYNFHVIVAVTDDGEPALTRYRRAIISVPTGGSTASGKQCPAIEVAAAPPFRDFADESVGVANAGYSTAKSSIGELLDNPATSAVVAKHLPQFVVMASDSPQARNMTLTAVQHFSPDITPEILQAIDNDLAGIPAIQGPQRQKD